LEKGYNLEKIFEVWHFSNKSDNLFKDYARDFMKIKLERRHGRMIINLLSITFVIFYLKEKSMKLLIKC
jgi:hypothetical protein